MTECKILVDNKEVKWLVDVAPHWGEPRISGVSLFSLCYFISVMALFSALIIIYNI